VQDHAVVLEPEAAGQLRVGGHLGCVDASLADDRGNLFIEGVRVGDVTLIEFEVHLQCFVGDTVQA
jgi:hypothetical protein